MNILLIEDDHRLCDMLTFLFEKEGIALSCLHTIADAHSAILAQSYDVIILDRMLPDGDGINLLQQLRDEHCTIPVLFLTALDETDEKVAGIECGADDYMVKPFDFKELFARVKMLARRSYALGNEILTFADLSYNPQSHIISCKEQSTLLSKKEAQLFYLLVSSPEKPISRDVLIQHIWGDSPIIESGNLDNQIYFLRKQLSIIKSQVAIKVSRGVGYYLSQVNTTDTKSHT